MERKAIPFELKEIDKSTRTAVIAHAAYNNIDLTDDISRKGMFTKSWTENKENINLYFNHNDEQAPGKVTDVYEDENYAYTKAWMGTHTLGNDVLIMMDEGVIKKASFGYIVERSNPITVKGKKVRELKEVKHLETSLLTKMPANPKTRITQVTKSLLSEVKTLSSAEQQILKRLLASDQGSLEDLIMFSGTLEPSSDLYTWIMWNISRRADSMGEIRGQLRYNSGEIKELSTHIKTLENFCRNSKASDDTIKSILIEIDNSKQLLSEYDTADTHADETSPEPAVSIKGKELLSVLTTFNKSLITT